MHKLPLLLLTFLHLVVATTTSAADTEPARLTNADLDAILSEEETDFDEFILGELSASVTPLVNETEPLSRLDLEAILAEEEALLQREKRRKLRIASEIELGIGYKENVTSSAVESTDSAFLNLRAETDIDYRLSDALQLEVKGEYGRSQYTNADHISDEIESDLGVTLTYYVDDAQAVNFQGTHYYFSGYLDSSVDDDFLFEKKFATHLFGTRAYYSRIFNGTNLWELGLKGTRTDVVDSIFDYNAYAIDGLVAMNEWLLFFEFAFQDTDNHPVREGDGTEIGSDTAQRATGLLYLSWSKYLDKTMRTKLSLTPSYRRTEDLHGSYDSYHRFGFAAKLTRKWDRGFISGKLGGKYQHYDDRTVFGATDASKFWRSTVYWEIEAEHEILNDLTLKAALRDEYNDSNDPLEKFSQKYVTLSAVYAF
ncbi:MAG: hypothetical protein ACSHYA_00380 [Opitutaceae bacterium]